MQLFSNEQIEKLNLSIPDISNSLDRAFRAAFSKEIKWYPKAMIGGDDGAFLMSTFCSWASENINIFHSLIGSTFNAQNEGAPAYQTLQLLSRYNDATPLALLDGTYTSRMLPAGITHLMSGRLAQARTGIATFVGAGTQARVNLDALDGVLPIQEVRIVNRTRSSAERFAEYVRNRGQKAVIMEAGPEAMNDADIIVTTIAATQGLKPFLDPAWVGAGTFVNAVDLGRSWKPGFSAFDYSVVDDLQQAEMQARAGRLPHQGPFDSEIADILMGAAPERTHAEQRIALIHPGNVVGIMGISSLLLSRLQTG